MDVGYFAQLLLLTLIIILMSIGLFYSIWLKRGVYVLPPSIREKPERIMHKDPTVETNMFRFFGKLWWYVFKQDIEIMISEIGFEQAYYLVFYRKMIKFMLTATPLILAFVFFCGLYTINDEKVLILRLFSAKEITILNVEVLTFASCVYTVALTYYLFTLRELSASENLNKVLLTETGKGSQKEDLWYEVRMMEVSGVASSDVKGEYLHRVLEEIMRKQKISGKLIKVTPIPCLDTSLSLIEKIENMREE